MVQEGGRLHVIVLFGDEGYGVHEAPLAGPQPWRRRREEGIAPEPQEARQDQSRPVDPIALPVFPVEPDGDGDDDGEVAPDVDSVGYLYQELVLEHRLLPAGL